MAVARSIPPEVRLRAVSNWETRRKGQAGAILGLEQEFLVSRGHERIDFRGLIGQLGLPGGGLDPGDRFAHRLPSGIAITADIREAEIALPPLRRRTNYAGTLAKRAGIALRTL